MPISYIKPSNGRSAKYYAAKKNIKRRLVVAKKRVVSSALAQKAKLPEDWDKKRIIKLIIKLGIAFVLIFAIYVFIITRQLPDPNHLIEREIAQSTKIYDRTGENLLYEVSGDQKRTLVPLNEIPEYVKQATIAIEDKNFYKHGGISIWAMARTAITNVLFNRSAGGSTLTQQFIKNAVLSPEKTITRKIKEMVMAQRLEKKFSKDEILQMYLNEIPYGSNAYGVEAASQKYFGKHVKDINLAEAAILAAITQAPSRYSPYGPNKDILIKRQQYVLDLMEEQGYISSAQKEEAKNYQLKFVTPDSGFFAPHFVLYVKALLAEKYGEKMVEQGGLKIYTTLDFEKQKIAEEVIKEKTANYPEKYNANNAALVSIDPKTGQILAMVGSRDYFNDDIDGQVNVVTSLRQPGSSIKPLVYATLFNKGYTPNTILYDVVTNFSAGGTPYEPRNYDLREHGPVSIRQALAGSLNVPAVKALYLAGMKNVSDLSKELGYTSLGDPDRYGLSLVLGGGEVELLEHANAFGAFARDGEIHQVASILKVEDKDGKVLEEYKDESKNALPSKTAQMINSILSDNNARSFIFGAQNYLTLSDRPVAAKTGTTNDYKDAWTVGYTPSLVTGVWVGNNNSKEMKRGADGSVIAAPIWHDYMAKALSGTPAESFNDPGDLITGKAVIDGRLGVNKTIRINKETGLLADETTPPELIEEISYSEPHCILYYVDKDNPLGPVPAHPENDPQFNLWESRVIAWAKKNNLYVQDERLGAIINNPANKPRFNITQPQPGEVVSGDELKSAVVILSAIGDVEVEYLIDNKSVSKKATTPYDLEYDISQLEAGPHELSVKVCDGFNCEIKTINFEK
ncbi:MAG TPA: PBP1A family penicillin-binding protein [bacterium]|nr:PBP1A family penicillin-binding protein [bacterium]HPT29478.1 PBP1A family penicillin-binding protein [bacterium]